MSLYSDSNLIMLDLSAWDSKNWNPAPRHLAVRYAMEAEGLIGRWCSRKYLQPILHQYRATSATSCWETIYLEKGIVKWKDGMLRVVLLALNRPMDPDLGLLELSGMARLADVREVALNLQMSFGATGCSLDEFPVPGFRNFILVQVDDFELAWRCWDRQGHDSKASTGREYSYSTFLHVDDSVGVNCVPEAELKAKLERGPLPELRGRQLNQCLPYGYGKIGKSPQVPDLEAELLALQQKLEQIS